MHEQFLHAALEQAWLGRGICAPNPSVGAVAVQNNAIIAQAWHQGAGTPHAEQLVLSKIPPHLSNITLYVTLEPCNHWGRTPPCVDAIIQYGIQRVVYAYADPNPIVSAKKTPNILSEHGVDVVYYATSAIDAFYQSYRHWTITQKPWITAKIAQTFDGKIAGAQGQRVSISNAMCAEFTHKNRLHSDVILTTAATINQDDPLFNARTSQVEQAKPVAILDRQLSLKPSSKVFKTAKQCIIYHDSQIEPAKKLANCSYYAMTTHQEQFNLNTIVCHLGSLGYHDVWVEAGAKLFNALHQARLVNKTHIYLAPFILGDASMPAYQHENILKNPRSISWQAMGDNMIATFEW